MNRFRLEDLRRWKTKKGRKPLLLRGARQVGKTWLARELGKSFESLVEINLEGQTELIPLFEEYYGKPTELVRYLSSALGSKITVGKSLLFLDEIQESPKALLSLRYFKENLPELHVIAAGSLIEFALKDLSFPVGRIEFFYVFPMTFREYLSAMGLADLAEQIGKASPSNPLPSVLHEQSLREVYQYTLIGGMPEVVQAFREGRDLERCQFLQQSLVANYRADFNKYSSKARIPEIRMVFDTVPRLLGQKFKYSQISKEIRSRELGAATHLLEDAGLAYRANHSSANGIPLSSEIKSEKFKVFSVDVGLCQRLLGVDLNKELTTQPSKYRGGLVEQFVAQELVGLTTQNDTPRLFYWHREAKSAQAEVDFILESKGMVLPIEVKSGIGGSLKSLLLFLKEKQIKRGFKISVSPFAMHSVADGTAQIVEIPLYAVGNLHSDSNSELSSVIKQG